MNDVKNDTLRCTRNAVWIKIQNNNDSDTYFDVDCAMIKKGIHIFIFDATNAVVLNSLNRIIKNEA